MSINITEECIAGCEENYYIQGKHKLYFDEPLALIS